MVHQGLIDGQKPDSKNELYVAMALDKLGLDYVYQYQIFGGRLVRGGQLIDFLVLKAPKPVPVYVGTEGYFHGPKQRAEDTLKKLEVQSAHPDWELPVDILEEESRTKEGAYQAVKEKVGV